MHVLSLIRFFSLAKSPRENIYHMVASEHSEVIEGGCRFISVDALDPEDAAEYGSIDDDGADLGEEENSGLVETGVSTGVTELGEKWLEEMQQAVKYSSLSSYMLKPTSLLTHGFK